LIADEAKHRFELRLRGAATFLRLPILAEYLDQLPGDAELHVCLENVDYIDHACFELLMNWADSHVEEGGSLVMDWDRLHGAFLSEANDEANATATRIRATAPAPAPVLVDESAQVQQSV